MLAFIAGICLASPIQSGESKSIDVDGVSRTALIYEGAAKVKSSPLIFCWHGHGQSGSVARNLFNLQKAWPTAMVVYPDGIAGIEDGGGEGGDQPGWQKYKGQAGDRDIKFFDKMLTMIKKNYKIDPKQIYCVGFSNGGRFTYLLWNERASTFAAFAAFSSQAINPDLTPTLVPKPAMIGHGAMETGISIDEAAASFFKVLAVNKCRKDQNKIISEKGGVAKYSPGPGGEITIRWVHPGGHEPPPQPGDEIVKFFKNHKLH